MALLEQQREDVLEQMRSIDRLRRGSLSRQFFKQERGGKTHSHGPYFVLQSLLHGEKRSERVPAEMAEQVGQHVKNYQRFQDLAEQFVTLTDRITRQADAKTDSKKNSRRKKSLTSDSARPKLS